MVRFAEGRIVEDWAVADELSLLHNLDTRSHNSKIGQYELGAGV
jgi:hypothetical protein